MKTISLILAASLACAVPAADTALACNAGEQPLTMLKPEERNAALKYWEAASSLNTELGAKISDVEYDEAGFTKESSGKCATFQAALKLFTGSEANPWIAASRYKKCDFEVCYEQGVMALLPHLGKLRSGARVVRFEARKSVIEDRPDDAAEAIHTLVRMGNHASVDGFLISSLVGNAIVSLAMGEAKAYAASGRMTESARDTIKAAFDEIDRDDPLRLRASIIGEKMVMLSWLEGQARGPQAGAQLAATIFGAGIAEEEEGMGAVHRKVIEQLDEQALRREIEQARKAYDEMLVAWDSPEEPVKACEQVSERISKLEFGPIAAVLCPSVTKVRSSALRFETTLKECREALEKAELATSPAQAP